MQETNQLIPFNQPPVTGNEKKYVLEALKQTKMSGDGPFCQKCEKWFEDNFSISEALITPSCTAALEMAALLINIKPGDEVIMPSYTFVSTANAFVLRGAVIVFVDVRSDTMNMDETRLLEAVTERTRAIVPVHYAGIACEMDSIMEIAEANDLYVVEDAAQGVMSSYKGRALGTIGHFGTFSFHETKNYTSGGEGGLLIVNDEVFNARSYIIREKGTNRSQFFRGMVDKYQWVDIGSSYLPSELQAAYLWGQLEKANDINANRQEIWERYYDELFTLESDGKIKLPHVPESCTHNAHMFYLKAANLRERSALLTHLRENNISAAFHYVPLHTSTAGRRFGRFNGQDLITSIESERIVRLPIWFGMSEESQEKVVQTVKDFYS